MNWTLVAMSLLFIVLGILIKYARWYWLIAGYNTATSEEKQQIDIEKLSHTMAVGLFVAGTAMLLFGIVGRAGFTLPGHIAMIIIPILLCVYLVWNGQKFNIKPQSSSREMTIGMGVLLGLQLLTVVVAIAIGVVYSSRPSVITSSGQQISISGIYGITEPKTNIQEIKLLNDIPPIQWKSNGFGFAQVRKGKFHLQNWGEGRLFLHSNKPPYIYIKTNNSYMLINYKDSWQTVQTYKKLSSDWKE